jgi:hypothetical protein
VPTKDIVLAPTRMDFLAWKVSEAVHKTGPITAWERDRPLTIHDSRGTLWRSAPMKPSCHGRTCQRLVRL